MKRIVILFVLFAASEAWSSTNGMESVTYGAIIAGTNKVPLVKKCRERGWPSDEVCPYVALGMIQALEGIK